jgi:hypothetical protein
VIVNGKHRTYKVESQPFESWLRYQYYSEKQKRTPPEPALRAAIRMLVSKAEFEGETPQHLVYLRTAAVNGKIYIDLRNDKLQIVEVGPDGWLVLDAPPDGVRFRQADAMAALPVPERGGSIEALRAFVNLPKPGKGKPDEFVLYVAALLNAFRVGENPILNFIGDYGSAKSTAAIVVEQLVDPHERRPTANAVLRKLPDLTRDLFIAAMDARVLPTDNISGLSQKMSDALCQVSDGSALVIRRLYTDGDQFRAHGACLVVLTNLANHVTSPDLVSRTITFKLEEISPTKRTTKEKFWRDFDEAHPTIFGALLNALAHGLRELPNVQLGLVKK